MADSLEKENVVWQRRPSIFTANAWFLLAAAALYALPWLATLLGSWFPLLAPLFQVMITPVYNLCVLAFPVAMYVSGRPDAAHSLRLTRPKVMECVEAAVLAIPAVFLCDQLTTWWLLLLDAIGGHLSATAALTAPGWLDLTTSIVTLAVLPALCEELLFRGGILGAWERRGTMYGLCLSSVLFCALHGSIQNLPTQLLMGFLLGLLVIRSGSLFTGMICHGTFNAYSLYSLFRSGGAPAEAYADVAGWVAQSGGIWQLLLKTVVSAFLCGAVLMMFMSHRSREPLEKVRPLERELMEWDELLLMAAALLTVAVRYGEDLLRICGWL